MATYENITIEKGMYKPGGYGLTEALEKLDPSENYIGTPLEGLDAFERQLKRFDIRVSGPGSDRIEKFFQRAQSTALFPEYVSRAVHQGMTQADVIDDIVASKTQIEGMDYRSVASVPTDSDLEIRQTNENVTFPETNVVLQENLVHLRKRGRMLCASYEALRFQRLDLFTVMLKQIGAHISTQLLNDAITIITNGDGNGNAATQHAVATDGTLAYGDLVDLWSYISPYKLNTIIAPTTQIMKMLNMPEMKDTAAGLNFHATGKMITPLGAKLIHAPMMNSARLIGLDKNYALELVQSGDVMTEYDKLIDRQLSRATISAIVGFTKIFTGASTVLTVTTS